MYNKKIINNNLIWQNIFLIIITFFATKTVYGSTHYECTEGGTLKGNFCLLEDCGRSPCSCSKGTLTCIGGSSSQGCSKYGCTIPATQVDDYACYSCGPSGQDRYWGSYTVYGQNCIKTNDTILTCEQDKCDGNKYTMTFDAGDGVISGTNNQTKTLNVKVMVYSGGKCLISNELINQFYASEPTAIPDDDSLEFSCWSDGGSCGYFLPIYSNKTVYARYKKKAPTMNNYNNLPDEEGEESVANVRSIYTVTYNPAGGHFINGSTENRITYIPSNLAIGDPKTNPIKDGYKFKEWQLDGVKFDFTQKPSKNITLTAVYEDLTDEDKNYKCDDNYIYEPTDKLCYKVLSPDNNNTFDYTLQNFSEGTRQCYNESIQFNNNATSIDEGKQNTSYDGYNEQESWISKDTCLIGTACPEGENVGQTACQIKWNAIIYSTKKPINKLAINTSDLIDEDGELDLTDKEIDSNGGTGDTLVYVAVILGLGALGYSSYYFTKKKRESAI